MKWVKTPKGTPAGYQPPSQGPFRCGNCEYSNKSATRCRKPEVIRELGAHAFGDGSHGVKVAVIQPNGCCNYFEKRAQTAPVSVEEHPGGLRIAR